MERVEVLSLQACFVNGDVPKINHMPDPRRSALKILDQENWHRHRRFDRDARSGRSPARADRSSRASDPAEIRLIEPRRRTPAHDEAQWPADRVGERRWQRRLSPFHRQGACRGSPEDAHIPSAHGEATHATIDRAPRLPYLSFDSCCASSAANAPHDGNRSFESNFSARPMAAFWRGESRRKSRTL